MAAASSRSSGVSWRALRMTSLPAAASDSAIARPIPRDDPATGETFPLRSTVIARHVSRCQAYFSSQNIEQIGAVPDSRELRRLAGRDNTIERPVRQHLDQLLERGGGEP